MAKKKVKAKKSKGKEVKAKKIVRKAVKKAARKTKRPASRAKKTIKKAAVKKERTLGYITHYFDKISVAAIKLTSPLSAGDWINIKGHTTDFRQKVDSIQINHVNVLRAKKGDEIGIKVKEYVRGGDKVYPSKEEFAKPPAPQPAAPKLVYKPVEFARPTLFKPMLPLKPKPEANKPVPQAAPQAPKPAAKPESKPAAKPEPNKDYSQIKFLGF